MKHIIVICILILSLISWALWAYGVMYFYEPSILNSFSQKEKETSESSSPLPLREGLGVRENSQEKNDNSQEKLASLQQEITTTISDIAPSIVSIIIKKDLVIYRSDPWWFFQQQTGTFRAQVWWGSWFFIKKDGTILTNKHVVLDTNAEYTVILQDGTEYNARILATDPVNDLAVIKIQDESKDFQVLPIIHTIDSIQIGQFGIAVGNALAEFQNSVSLWIISGKDRVIEAQGQSLSWLLQTDAAINPGNSGWPLLNLLGEVVWINTAIVSGSDGIGFAIALTQDKIDYMLKSIDESGRIKRPFIGINYITNSPGVAQELWLATDYGLYIIDEPWSIIEGTSAQKAGIEPGDIIISVNSQKITSPTLLGNIIQNSIPEDILSLEIIKKSGKKQTIDVELWEY